MPVMDGTSAPKGIGKRRQYHGWDDLQLSGSFGSNKSSGEYNCKIWVRREDWTGSSNTVHHGQIVSVVEPADNDVPVVGSENILQLSLDKHNAAVFLCH